MENENKVVERTKWLVVICVFALVVYDIAMYLIYGGVATISTIIGNWSIASLWVSVLLGGLLGHFVGSGDGQDWEGYAIRLTLVALSITVGFVSTAIFK
jgi:hypothetical protein